MPETPISREQLLASVHVLEPGDILIVRCPEGTTQEKFEQLRALLHEKLDPLGIECLMMTRDLDYEVVRPAGNAA